MSSLLNVIFTLVGLILLIGISYILFSGLNKYQYNNPTNNFLDYIKYVSKQFLKIDKSIFKSIGSSTTKTLGKDTYDLTQGSDKKVKDGKDIITNTENKQKEALLKNNSKIEKPRVRKSETGNKKIKIDKNKGKNNSKNSKNSKNNSKHSKNSKNTTVKKVIKNKTIDINNHIYKSLDHNSTPHPIHTKVHPTPTNKLNNHDKDKDKDKDIWTKKITRNIKKNTNTLISKSVANTDKVHVNAKKPKAKQVKTSNITNKIDSGLNDLKKDKFHINSTKVVKPISDSDKEVFNISQNIFTYNEAPLVCKAYDADLATYDQVVKSFKKGANWCNYGWSDHQMALFPIQEKYYDELQKGPIEHREDCGAPGVNGGYFHDPNLKFGVNCYGHKPKPKKNSIVYTDKNIVNNNVYEMDNLKHKLDKIKNKIKKNNVAALPFNPNKWEATSKQNSKYIIENTVPSIPEDLKHDHTPVNKCASTIYGCCPDGNTVRADSSGTNCPFKGKCEKPSTDNNHYVTLDESVLEVL